MIPIIGLLVTVSLLCLLTGGLYLDVHWMALYRQLMQSRADVRTGPIDWYLTRIRHHHERLDKPYSNRKTIALVGVTALMVIGIAYKVLHLWLPVAIGCGVILEPFLYERWLSNRWMKMEEAMLFAFLNESLPLAMHVLTATGRLDLAFKRMSERTQHKGLAHRLKRLSQLAHSPNLATPEDALFHWAVELRIPAISHLALATKMARRYQVPIVDVWTEVSEILGKDLDYLRQVRAHTAGHRKGAYIFYSLLAVPMLIAYTIAGPAYLGVGEKVLFWIVMAMMSIGLYWMVRKSQVIDV